MSRIVKRVACYISFIFLCILCAVVVLACGNDDEKNAAPCNLFVGNDMYLRWDAASDAGMYIVEFDGVEYETETNCFDVLALTAEPTKHAVRVMAVYKNGYESAWSELYFYEEENVSLRYALECYFLDDSSNEVGITVRAKSVCSGKVFIPSAVNLDGIIYQVTEIDTKAFMDCKNMTCVVIPETVAKIPSNAFRNCDALERALLPDGLTEIGIDAFRDCIRLKDVVLPNTLVSVKNGAFVRTGLTELKIPKSITNITNVFGNDALAKLTVDEYNTKYYSENNCIIRKNDRTLVLGCNSSVIPDGVDVIDSDAFRYSGITHIDIPNGIKQVKSSAFEFCAKLKSVHFSDGLETLQRYSFLSCPNIERLYIPKTVTKLEGAFAELTGLESLEVDPANAVYRSENNCIFRRDEPTLVLGCKNSVVPDSVEKIEERAFCGCELNDFVFPSRLKTIGSSAFADTNLTSVALPVGLETIQSYAFSSTPLAEVFIPRTVKYIESGAFENTNLRSVTIPDSVETIKINAFSEVAVYISFDITSLPSDWMFMQLTSLIISNSFTNSCVFFGCELGYDGEYPYVISANDNIRFTHMKTDELSEDCGAPLRNGYEYKGFSEQAGGEVSIGAYTSANGKLCSLSKKQKESLAPDTVLYAVWSEI
ncbi:MAG: leucine-rich repeat domain-containing protein [Clostridiales bacterium]|nr:leucine-rich repeat domain-containing protein [Clostridiales bacterium]